MVKKKSNKTNPASLFLVCVCVCSERQRVDVRYWFVTSFFYNQGI